jgi:hypothetical protein
VQSASTCPACPQPAALQPRRIQQGRVHAAPRQMRPLPCQDPIPAGQRQQHHGRSPVEPGQCRTIETADERQTDEDAGSQQRHPEKHPQDARHRGEPAPPACPWLRQPALPQAEPRHRHRKRERSRPCGVKKRISQGRLARCHRRNKFHPCASAAHQLPERQPHRQSQDQACHDRRGQNPAWAQLPAKERGRHGPLEARPLNLPAAAHPPPQSQRRQQQGPAYAQGGSGIQLRVEFHPHLGR